MEYSNMNVKLISITPDTEKTIMRCARVSSPKTQNSDNPKLIKYCIDNGHFSILEMANMVVEIETSRAISSQIIRHRSLTFQEHSQRYSESNEFEVYEARRQDTKNRQNSIDDMSKEDKTWFLEAQAKIQAQAQSLYNEALKREIAKEQARFLLPLSTKTRLYMNGSIRSYIHYIQSRTHESTQLEHRLVANAIKKVFVKELPIISQALGWK